jgi:DNA-binding NtrC family response regulator
MTQHTEKTPPRGSLLIVDDEEDVIYSFRRLLADEGYELLSAHSGEEGVQIFREKRPDLVLMDVRMAGIDGLQALQSIRKIDPKALVIIMTAFSSTGAAIEAMKAGAYDYVLKPFDIEKIKRLLREAMRSSESMKSVVSYQPLLSREDHQQGIIGKSDPMQAVYKEIGRVAAKNIPVLISGETGTGKELVARAIYHHSDRHEKRFIPINCGAIPETLLESELFGHERGAFTGAHARKIGKFEVADEGTIFLDEIGELPHSIQAKLLRALQEKEIERLGGTAPIKVDVRIIAATNRNLPEMIRRKLFREDLYYRLNVVNIELPPLRERIEDIPLLSEYFVERFAADYGGKFTISEEAVDLLMNYSWPGNVRELENVIKNSLVRAKGQVLLPGTSSSGRKPPRRRPARPRHRRVRPRDARFAHGAGVRAGAAAAPVGRGGGRVRPGRALPGPRGADARRRQPASGGEAAGHHALDAAQAHGEVRHPAQNECRGEGGMSASLLRRSGSGL